MIREHVPYTINDVEFLYPNPKSVQFLFPKENIPHNSYLIEEIAKAGFNIDSEYKRRQVLKKEFGEEKGNKIFVSATTDEILEYAFEYSRKDAVRRPKPYLLKGDRLFSPSYQEYLDVFSKPFEREGATYEGVLKVQALLKNAPKGAFVIWSSPLGWVSEGYEPYKYSWTHIFWKDGFNQDGDDNVMYVSLRTKLDARQLAQWSNHYLSGNDKFDLQSSVFKIREGIKKVVSTPVLVIPEQFGIKKLSDFTKPIDESIRNYSEIIYSDEEGISYTLSELAIKLDKAEQTSITERDIMRPLIEYFENELFNAQTEEEVKMIIANYFLEANQILREHKNLHMLSFQRLDSKNFLVTNPSQTSILLSTLQKVGGCGLIQNAATFTSVKEIEPFTCPSCGFATFDRVGNKCPACGLTKEKYIKIAKQKGELVCD